MSNYNEVETITRYLDSLERRISTLETSERLLASGIGAGGISVYNRGSITVKDRGSVNIYDGGSLEIYGASDDLSTITVGSGGKVVSDGAVQFSKSSTFSGDVSITGNLTVTGNLNIKSGLIESNALKNQMSGVRRSATSTDFSIGTSFADKASVTATAPSWANTAIVHVSGSSRHVSSETDSSGNRYYADIRATINSTSSQDHMVGPAGTGDTEFGSTAGFSRVISSPSTIDASIQLRSTRGTIPSNSFNRADVSMYVVFYR